MARVNFVLDSKEIEDFTDFGIADGFFTRITSAEVFYPSHGNDKYDFRVYFETPEARTDSDIDSFLLRYADFKGDR